MRGPGIARLELRRQLYAACSTDAGSISPFLSALRNTCSYREERKTAGKHTARAGPSFRILQPTGSYGVSCKLYGTCNVLVF